MSSWNEFLKNVKQAELDLGNPKEIWYRGHSNEAWKLTPSLMREVDFVDKEKELFNEYQKTAARLFDKRNTDWEILFDMQHYWIPTRLLDWTTVMGVAVAFILYDAANEEQESSLYVLDPLSLNRLSGRGEVINVPEAKGFEYKSMYWDHLPVKIEKPLAIRPGQQSDRIRAQKGVFTVHGNSEFGFEESASETYKKIVMPVAAKEEAKDFLRRANLDEYTIYPDIVGMAHHIKRKVLGRT